MFPVGLSILVPLVRGCSSGCGRGPFGADCLPEPLTVDPAEVVVGGEVTVSTTGLGCDAHYGEGKQYGLRMLFLGRSDAVVPGDVHVAGTGRSGPP
jgi:hypothetical protein